MSDAKTSQLPAGWTLSTTSFSWTREIIRARTDAESIVAAMGPGVGVQTIELDPGQVWRSFPHPSDADIDRVRLRLEAANVGVSLIALNLDAWTTPGQPRSPDQLFEQALAQLRVANRIGARGVRVPAGHAGPVLLRRLLPMLEELGLTLYEEIQGQQHPGSPQTVPLIEALAALDTPRVRLLIDTSMLMPALPQRYLDAIDDPRVPRDLMARLHERWTDPDTPAAIKAFLATVDFEPAMRRRWNNMLSRFGYSSPAVLGDILPLVGGFHLKFWDLYDVDGRVSRPLEELGRLLSASGFIGEFCSEWGGHDWMDDADATDTVRRHLALARVALSKGAQG